MHTIQDNFRFIDITFDNGLVRSICKDYIREIDDTADSNSIFLDLVNDEGLSLNYWEFATIINQNKPYPSLSDFYIDLSASLNGSDSRFTFYPQFTVNTLDQNDQTSLDYSFEGDKDGILYYILLNASDPVPSVNEVINAQAPVGGTLNASGTENISTLINTINISGLTTLTAYDLYVVTANTDGDEIMSSVIKLTQTTLP